MSIVRTIAYKFLTKGNRSRFLSFISTFSFSGVALGVAALIVAMAIMEGFEVKLRSLITSNHSHIILYSTENIILNGSQLERRIEEEFSDEIEAVSSFVFSEVMLAYRGRVIGSLLEGVDEAGARRTTKVLERISEGSFSSTETDKGDFPPIVIGSAIAKELGIKRGEVLSVVTPFFEKGTMSPHSKKFRLSGVLSTGMYEYDSKYSLIHKDEGRRFFSSAKKKRECSAY